MAKLYSSMDVHQHDDASSLQDRKLASEIELIRRRIDEMDRPWWHNPQLWVGLLGWIVAVGSLGLQLRASDAELASAELDKKAAVVKRDQASLQLEQLNVELQSSKRMIESILTLAAVQSRAYANRSDKALAEIRRDYEQLQDQVETADRVQLSELVRDVDFLGERLQLNKHEAINSREWWLLATRVSSLAPAARAKLPFDLPASHEIEELIATGLELIARQNRLSRIIQERLSQP